MTMKKIFVVFTGKEPYTRHHKQRAAERRAREARGYGYWSVRVVEMNWNAKVKAWLSDRGL